MRTPRIHPSNFSAIPATLATLLFAPALWAQQYALGDTGIPADYDSTIRDLTDKMDGDYPLSFDWRDYGMVTPAKDQAMCGNCWAFASAGTLESKLLINDYGEYDLSEQFQTSCDTTMAGCSGGSMSALQFWQTEGPMMEACTGFPSADGADRPCSDFSSCPQLPSTASGYYTVDMSNPEYSKASAYADGPGYFRFNVYYDFITYWDTAAPDAVYTNANGSFLGGHAVLIIGWDDSKQAWLLKNSWGETGGPNGDGTFWMAYSGHANSLGFGMANLQDVTVGPTSDCTCDVGCDAVRTSAGTLNTTGAVCYEITSDIKGWTAWELAGRVIEVNDVLVYPGAPLPPKINGKYYFGFSAGSYPWAGWTHWTW